MPDKDLRDIRTVILSLPKDQQWQWADQFGTGDRDNIQSILSQINTDATERGACDVLKRVLGIEVMTEKERAAYLAQEERELLRRNVEANEKLAADAERRGLAEEGGGIKREPVTELHIFVSWSANKSHQVARVLKDWLPKVIPQAKPWVSSVDIRKGKSWFVEISGQLAKSPAGIICVTPENIGAPWIYYEAGAIAQALADPACVVCPYLVGVQKGDLSKTPLGQLQLTTADKEDTYLMIQSLNQSLATPNDEKLLKTAFNSKWPSLQAKLVKIVGIAEPASPAPTPPAPPTSEEPLSDLARRLLVSAVTSEHQSIFMNKDGPTGFNLGAGRVPLVQTHDGRQEAEGREAVETLERRNLIKDKGTRRENFALTPAGYRLADSLSKAKNPNDQTPPPSAPLTDEGDILVALQTWFRTKCRGHRTPQIAFADVDRELNLQPGTAARLLERAADTMGWVPDVKGTNLITFRHRRVIGRG